jgi:hypothetical protein
MTTKNFEIIVDDSPEHSLMQQSRRKQRLASWVMDKVDSWEDWRDRSFKEKWEEYYRLWRGTHTSKDKNRSSERSRLVNPAISQAVESTVAELEEATFGKGMWFDIVDDMADPQKEDMMIARNMLHEDFEKAGIPDSVSKTFLYGAIYGTGIAKIMVDQVTRRKIAPQITGFRPSTITESEVEVKLEAINPHNFVIDPAGRTISEALGCAHIVYKPLHTIVEKQVSGVYEDVKVGPYDVPIEMNGTRESYQNINDAVKIVEYYGLVPAELLYGSEEEGDVSTLNDKVDNRDLVESLITVANDGILLRAVENPYLMQDRPILAYQHDTVPNSFWGRGIVEKGYNSQKALDAELRARIDALALVTHPMMAIDVTRVPKGQPLSVRPGKTFLTQGDPSQVFMPFKFGDLNPVSFSQSADLERQIQMGTGAMDSATPTSINPRNQTASGMSMIMAGMLKRHKRSKQNIDRQFLDKFIEKALWRYMQFSPERYPAGDYKFITKASMGLMAREYEQGQLTQLLSIVPQDSPMFGVILKGIFDNSSMENKGELLNALNQYMNPQPNPEAEQKQRMMEELAIEQQVSEIKKTDSEAIRNIADAEAKGAKQAIDGFNSETNRLNAIANIQKEGSKEK